MSILSKKQPLFTAIVLAESVAIVSLFMKLLEYPSNNVFAVLKYLTMTIATFLMVKDVMKDHLKCGPIRVFFFIWIIYLFVSAAPNIINPYRNYLHLKQFLTTLLFMYSLPVFMVAKLDVDFLRRLFKFSFVLLWLYIITVVFFEGIKLESCTILAEGSIILMMTWPYHAPKKRVVIVLVFILAIIGMMISARRNKVVYYGGGLTLALVINILSNDHYTFSRRITLVVLSFLLGIGLIFASDYFGEFFNKMSTGMDSRQGVIDRFVYDFDSQPSDWVFGRGLYGQFDGGFVNTDEELELRDVIENGYLYLILKGGGIWLVLLTLIALNAIYKGLFKSKNLLCKGFAMILILYYVDMVGFGIPQTTLKYIMIFISIAGCNTEWLRDCSNKYLSDKIGLK